MCTSVWFQMLTAEAAEKRPRTLKRKKREWILPPAKLEENTDYTEKEFIAKVISTFLLLPTITTIIRKLVKRLNR